MRGICTIIICLLLAIDMSAQIKEKVPGHPAQIAGKNELPQTKTTDADRIINEAMKYLGTPYKYGSPGPKTFDCSGFTSYIYRNFGIELVHSSRGQSLQGRTISDVHELHRGDLVFFGGRAGTKIIGHVGIVVDVDKEKGSFRFIHASTQFGVRIDDCKESPYFLMRYKEGARILNDDGSLPDKAGKAAIAEEAAKVEATEKPEKEN